MISDIEKQRIRTLSRGIIAKLFNKQVIDRYSDNQDLLDTCTVQSFDTVPEMLLKQIAFYFTLDNFTPQVNEKLVMRNKGAKKPIDNLPWMLLHVKFKERYIFDKETGEEKPLGQRRIRISNIDEKLAIVDDVKKSFNGMNVKYGSNWLSYNFKNGREIRLEHLSSREQGIKLIKASMPFTVKEHQHEGEIEDNVFDVKPPKNTPKLDTDGLIGHIFKVTFHKREGNKTNKLATVYVANEVSKNKY